MKNQSKTFRPTTLTVVGVIILVGLILNWETVKNPTIDPVLVKAANEVNRTLPMMLDGITQLDSTVAMPNKTFCYYYTLIGIEPTSFDKAQFDAIMKPQLTNIYRTSNQMTDFRNRGVNLTYVYKFENGTVATEISIFFNQL